MTAAERLVAMANFCGSCSAARSGAVSPMKITLMRFLALLSRFLVSVRSRLRFLPPTIKIVGRPLKAEIATSMTGKAEEKLSS